MATPDPGQQIWPGHPQLVPRQFRPTLPVTQTGYPSFWRTPAWSWWRPIVALLFIGVGWVMATLVFLVGATAIDVSTGRVVLDSLEAWQLTPLGFIANNLGLASMIVFALVISLVVFKQRAGFVSSVAGRMRWGWLGRCLLVITPIWLVFVGGLTWWEYRTLGAADLGINQDTWVLLIGILLTTPLQAAGEEFGFRGVINRAAASFSRNPKVALVIGAVISSLAFMAAHAALDPWLNLYYFSFGIIACILTWRTGGLEAAIAMHVVNNLLSLAPAPFSDFSDLFNRESGAGDPSVLIGVAVMVGACVLLLWQARVKGIQTTSAPGQSTAAAWTGGAPPASGWYPGASLPAPPPLPRPAPAPRPAPGPPPQPPQAAAGQGFLPLTNPRPWEGGPTIGQR
ncbi:MAG: CPBP family intramembrane glutamic endopeptidase [Brooklawnia sp.]|jgi:membrane protease YdiL (CAAX protease family)